MTEKELFSLLDKWAVARLPVLMRQVLNEWMDDQQTPGLKLSRLDAYIADTVGDIWRDQGKRPATTLAISNRMGYSRQHTLKLCKVARDNGAIVEVPGRGDRCSGKWVPLIRAA